MLQSPRDFKRQRMPGSLPVFDTVLETLIGWMAPDTALDVGTGSGKFGHMLQRAAPGCDRSGIEIEASYIERFALRELYPTLHHADVTRWWRETEGTYDLVVMGDCIEHLPKSEGLDLLNALVYRCAWLVLVVPEFIVQGAVGDMPSERHVSVWSERDLHWHDLWAWDNCRAMGLMVLRGYLPSTLSLAELVQRCNAGVLPVHDFDGLTLVRPARLRLVEHAREVSYRRA